MSSRFSWTRVYLGAPERNFPLIRLVLAAPRELVREELAANRQMIYENRTTEKLLS